MLYHLISPPAIGKSVIRALPKSFVVRLIRLGYARKPLPAVGLEADTLFPSLVRHNRL